MSLCLQSDDVKSAQTPCVVLCLKSEITLSCDKRLKTSVAQSLQQVSIQPTVAYFLNYPHHFSPLALVGPILLQTMFCASYKYLLSSQQEPQSWSYNTHLLSLKVKQKNKLACKTEHKQCVSTTLGRQHLTTVTFLSASIKRLVRLLIHFPTAGSKLSVLLCLHFTASLMHPDNMIYLGALISKCKSGLCQAVMMQLINVSLKGIQNEPQQMTLVYSCDSSSTRLALCVWST